MGRKKVIPSLFCPHSTWVPKKWGWARAEFGEGKPRGSLLPLRANFQGGTLLSCIPCVVLILIPRGDISFVMHCSRVRLCLAVGPAWWAKMPYLRGKKK